MRTNALAVGLLASVALTSTAWANADQTKNAANPDNWAMQSGNYTGQRYSKLDQINTKNVNTLKARRSLLAT
jgi:lanthanide-dependent methanol dehydrogenase